MILRLVVALAGLAVIGLCTIAPLPVIADEVPQVDKPGPGRIAGRLIDEGTGLPVAGALIGCSAIRSESGSGGGSKVTGADGAFLLDGLSPGVYVVWLKKYLRDPKKTTAADEGVLVEAGKTASSELRLVTGRRIVGTLVDAQGRPCGDRSIGCHSTALPTSLGSGASTKTDASGSFEFHVPPGRAYLYVTPGTIQDGPGSDETVIDVPSHGTAPVVSLRLRPLERTFGDAGWVLRSTAGTKIVRNDGFGRETLSGYVVDPGGAPIAGARVFKYDGADTTTSEKGYFELNVGKGNQFILHAWAEGFRVWFGTPTSGDVLKIVLEPKTGAVPRGIADLPENAVAISVRDAKTNRPIPSFHVIAGVKGGSSANTALEERSGKSVVNWQPHTLRVGTDGYLVWSLARAYDEMALRIEAEGYVPQRWLWIRRDEGARSLVFALESDPGIVGRILQPDGKPAAKATLAIAKPQSDAALDHGRLRGLGEPLAEKPGDRWRRPAFFESDAEGRFRLPTETDSSAALLVVHESGVAEMPFAEVIDSPDLHLKGWGRIEGRVLWNDKPGAGEPIALSIHRDDYGYPGTIAQYDEVVADAEGRFTIERVLPGLVQISRWTKVTKADKSTVSVVLPGMYRHAEVRSGDPTNVIMGGRGRRFTGRLMGRSDWTGVTIRIHPNAPHIGFPGDDDMWRAFGEFQNGPLGPLFFRDGLKPNADGTFEIADMLPGDYQVFVSAPDVENYAGGSRVTIPPETPGESPAAFDAGRIPVKDPKKN